MDVKDAFAVVAIIRHNDRVLVLSKPGVRKESMIVFPGGKIERGETVVEAAVRELNEETELNLSACDLEIIGARVHPMTKKKMVYCAGSYSMRMGEPCNREVAKHNFVKFCKIPWVLEKMGSAIYPPAKQFLLK